MQTEPERPEDVSVEPAEVAKTVAYCGLVCGLCPPPHKCDCRSRPARKDCPIRACCIEKKLDGCWQCPDFPCHMGYVADDKGWRNLCFVSCTYVREHGTEGLARLILDKHGHEGYHGPYVHQTREEIRRRLGIDPNKPGS
jgi:hypothetical protein